MDKWLIKSEPTVYGWDQLVKEKKTRWDGIRSYAARNFLRAMKKGDQVLFYHSNKGMEIVGICKVLKEAYPDPAAPDDDWSAIDIAPVKKLKNPVPLTVIKKEKSLKDMALVKLGRLSVQPVTNEEWERVMELSGT